MIRLPGKFHTAATEADSEVESDEDVKRVVLEAVDFQPGMASE